MKPSAATSLADEERDDIDTNREDNSFPFDASLFVDVLDCPPRDAEATPMLTTSEILTWLQSDTVLPYIQQWKAGVIDVKSMRIIIQAGFSLDKRQSWDTVDCLIRLCYGAGKRIHFPANDAWEATAYCAHAIVWANGHSGSPFESMVQRGYVD